MAGEPRIIVGFHSTGMCPTAFAIDLARMMRYSGTIIPFAMHEQSCYVDTARNNLVRNFLKTEGSHLMMMDVDMGFEPNAVLQTYEILHSQQAEVCYGNYVLGNGGNSIFGPPENKSKEAAVLVNLDPNVVYTDISTGGTGWLLATRPLLERMQKECPGPWHWFGRDLTSDGKDYRGEDVTFGLRLWAMNPRPKVVGQTVTLLRHYKTQPLVPEKMSPVVKAFGQAAIGVPNPYEDETKYIINGHQVIEKTMLTPEQVEHMRQMIAMQKGATSGTVHGGNVEVQEGGPAQWQQEGQEGNQPQAGSCDYAQREESSGGGKEGIPAAAERPRQEKEEVVGAAGG